MKCSECSKEILPVVAVDIDGTLGDYHGHLAKFMDSYFGRGHENKYRGGNRLREWAVEEYGCTIEEFRDAKLAYRQGGQKRSMPVFPGAVDLCQMVKAEGAELWITTTRPYLRLDNVDPDTRFWLDRYGIKRDGLLYDESKYDRLAYEVDPARVVAVLDDLPEMIDQARENFGAEVPIFRRNDYNTDHWTRYGGEANLDAVRIIVRDRIGEWKELHG